jgi:aminoglycoside phosphotransferase (APT) family kinase protein
VSHAVFVPCAGLGTRLGEKTRHMPKALVSVGHQPAITRVLRQFPRDSRFVVALGYQGELLREYLAFAHPDLDIETVEVDPYDGYASGLGTTLLQAADRLQSPFIFCSCDTLVGGTVPAPDRDWAAWADAVDLSPYRTLELDADGRRVLSVREKGTPAACAGAYVGLAGVADWRTFWRAMREGGQRAIDEGEAHGLSAILREGPIEAWRVTWHDTGSPAGLAAADAAYPSEVDAVVLPKATEAIWFFDGQVVKFSTDADFIAHRVSRAAGLRGFVPEPTGHSRHFYRYRRVEGEVLSRRGRPADLARLFARCRDFWKPATLDAAGRERFRRDCLAFYRDKTRERLARFYETFGRRDDALEINGVPTPALDALLSRVDWHALADGLPGRFHGDFHFENILAAADGGFVFLDWRQDFCGDLAVGDVYYDLAKLNHGLIVNHALIDAGRYEVRWNDGRLDFDFDRHQRLVECEAVLARWCAAEGFDTGRVRLLTALVYLNIAALHHAPYSLMLYGLGTSLLHRELDHAH